MESKKKKLIKFTLGAVILTAASLAIGINGFFGGGDTIPDNTFLHGLVGYWSFDEGSGTIAYDASGNGNNGTLYNSPQWTDGKHGGALEFDSSNDYMCATDSSTLDLTTGATLSGWFKKRENNEFQTILEKTGAYRIRIEDNNEIMTRYYFNDSTETGEKQITGPTDNDWHYVVSTFNNISGEVKLYLDGNLINTWTGFSDKIIADRSDHFHIGSRGGSTTFFKGTIDEVKIYNRALSAEEIHYHYNRGAPVGHWKMDEGSGSTIYDESDNHNDGTLTLGSSGNTTVADAWTDGKHGSALNLDGTDDYIDCGNDASLEIADEITIEAWIKADSWTSPSNAPIATKLLADDGYWFWAKSDGELNFYIKEGGTQKINHNTTQVDMQIGSFYHVAVTWDKTDGPARFYKNGELIEMSSSYLGTIGTDNGDLRIGTDYGLDDNFNGTIDDVRIYSYARTAEEIRLDYNAGMAIHLGPSEKSCSEDPASCMDYGLVNYWPMDEASGNTAYDISGNDINGTIDSSFEWTTGKIDGASKARGSGNINCGDPDILDFGTGDMTVELWYKRKDTRNWMNVINKYPGSNNSGWYIVDDCDSNVLIYKISSGGGLSQRTVTLSDNDWHHILMVRDGDYHKGYLDGVEKFSYSGFSSYDLSNSTDLKMLISMMGTIDDVRIYNRALSAEEASYHYNKGAPVAHWKMDEGSGSTIYDEADNNNNGTISGAAWVEGKHGLALSLDGINDYVDCGSNDSLNFGTNDFTIALWAKTKEDSFRSLAGKTDSTANSGYSIDSYGEIRFILDDNNSYMAETTETIDDNNWHHIVALREGDNLKIYIDGLLSATDSGNDNINVTSDYPFIIGARNSGADAFFDGSVDDVRIYNYARTAEEIRKDYNTGLAAHLGTSDKSCSEDPASCMDYGLESYWSMNESSGSTVYDSSDNSNDGTINGASWSSGKYDSALSFDGRYDYVSNISDINIPTVFTVELWAKPDVHDGSLKYIIWRNDDRPSIRVWGGTKWRFCIDGNNGNGFSSVSDISVGEWTHLVLTFDGEVGRGYVNGVEEVSRTDSTYTEGTTLRIGGDGVADRYLDGSIDEVKIYNRVLNAEEISYHYNKGQPIAHWKMDEGSGSTIYDESGNHNKGTLVLGSSGNTTTSDVWVDGKYGSALNFDGTDDYVDCGTDDSLSITEDLTLEAWVFPTGNLHGETLISKHYNTEYDLTFWSQKLNYYNGPDYNDGNSHQFDYTFGTDDWYHVVATRVGGTTKTVKLYVNGSYVDDFVYNSTPPSSSNKVGIGYRIETSSQPFPGVIDDVRIYSYARTAEQILMDYNNGLATHFE
ncbi:LamG domain-containing protein [Candidatus Parcubacteria bacterium]|nr:LamG domain-containing protein [Candidatus Parcubacteria bacterium]